MFTTFSTRRLATLLLTIIAACCGMSAAEPAFAAKPFKSQFQRRVVGDISHPANAAAAAPRQANSPSAGADGRMAGLLDDLRKQGLDTAGLERFLNGQLRQIDRLEQPQALPDGLDGWLVAIGAKDPPSADPAALARWREGLKQKTKDFWARKLATGNHDEIIQGIKQWGGALGKFDQADQDAAAAAIESIKAHQELTENVAGAVPLLGEAIDVLAIARGESLSGEKTTAISVLLTAAANLGPIGLDKFLKRGGKQTDEVLKTSASSPKTPRSSIATPARKLPNNLGSTASTSWTKPWIPSAAAAFASSQGRSWRPPVDIGRSKRFSSETSFFRVTIFRASKATGPFGSSSAARPRKSAALP